MRSRTIFALILTAALVPLTGARCLGQVVDDDQVKHQHHQTGHGQGDRDRDLETFIDQLFIDQPFVANLSSNSVECFSHMILRCLGYDLIKR